MTLSPILDNLNEHQRAAVAAAPGNLLVLAGAGSGKTRVLVHRIAWLIQTEGVSPYNIMAVTFTNKAAGEMRSRLESMLQFSMGAMWVGTFHGLAHRFLRAHWREANLPQTFQILDSDDQNRLIKRIHKNLNLDDAKWPPKQSQWFINNKKENGIRPKHIHSDGHYFTETMSRVYQAYEQACQTSGLVDFSELLLRTYELLQNSPELLQHYQQRFRHILVDEFQDTNFIQYAWIKLLGAPDSHVMIVGDDDQSIYGWRGARVENIQRFTKDFANPQTIRLEQNYRSTQTILAAANAIIENNENRMGKNLWTQGLVGEPISVYSAFNEYDEARFIIERIRDWSLNGNARREAAILYRSNAQSRVLEEELIKNAIPYRVYGGLKFFERMEIKDALGYLRLLSNRHDDTAFERVVNTPTRGIGMTTLTTLREQAQLEHLSLWQTAETILEKQNLTPRASQALMGFLQLINQLAEETKELPLGELTDVVLKKSGLFEFYQQEKSEKALSRIENLDELINATREFTPQNPDNNLTPLDAFLSHAALEAGEGQATEFEDCVQLMTMHSAKGLEFPLVFICGMEEGLFPHHMSAKEADELEEERRLCYVGMTRAMQKLYFTYAENRRLHGTETYHRPSRFLQEIPEKFLQPVRLQTKVSRPLSASSPIKFNEYDQSAGDTGFMLGQRVKHEKFGEGVVVNFEGQGGHARIQVKFHKAGTKWLVLSYANLTSC